MIKFKPTGSLDVTSDPSALPEQGEGRNATSGEMTRCLNLTLDRMGEAATRKGSSRFATQVTGGIHRITEQAGFRYTFAGSAIYKDEASIASSLTDTMWTTGKYKTFTEEVNSIFATNGTDKKRISGSDVNEWGIDAPTVAPTLDAQTIESVVGDAAMVYTFDWEKDEGHTPTYSRKLTTEEELTPITYVDTGFGRVAVEGTPTTYAYIFDWEPYIVTSDKKSELDDSVDERQSYDFELTTGWSETDEYGVVYTYVRKVDTAVVTESNPSPATTGIASTGLQVTWTASTDPQVTHVRIYRTIANGATYLYADEVAIGETSIVLSVADTLGNAVETDHNRVPDNVTALSNEPVNGYLFASVGHKVYFCKPQQPEYWPTNYFIEVGTPQFPVRSIQIWNGQPYAITTDEVWQIQGTGFESFYGIPMKAKTGTLAEDTAEPVAGLGIFHMAIDGIYLFDGMNDERVFEERLGTIWEGETSGNVPGGTNFQNSLIIHYKGQLFVGYPSTTYPDNWIMYRTDHKKTHHYQYAADFRAIAIDYENDRIITGDTDGYLWQLETGTADNSTAIGWEVESKQFTDQVRKYMPRYAKYDVSLEAGSTATGKIVLDGSVKQEHTITSRQTKKRLITPCTGDRLSSRISGTGPATIYQSEID
jgi:hypothetical protein